MISKSLGLNQLKSIFLKNTPSLKRNIKSNLKVFSTFIGSYFFYKITRKKKAYSCGIIAFLGKNPDAIEICTDGIQILQSRGYDSCGICTIDPNNNYETTKFSSDFKNSLEGNCIKKLCDTVPNKHSKSCIGIAHTRWATHGKKTEINAHPHFDFSNKIALVHNGVIDNCKDLKVKLNSLNIHPISETDSELIAHLIGYYHSMGMDFKSSVEYVLNKEIVGSYALVIMNKDYPNKLICARSGSPLLIGIGEGFYIISSDSAAFQKYTSYFFPLENQQILEIDLNFKIEQTKIQHAKFEEFCIVPKENFEYFMLQEIFEQIDTIKRAINNGGRLFSVSEKIMGVKLGGLEDHKDYLKLAKNLVIVACGTSYHAGLFASYLMRKIKIFNSVQVIDAAEFNLDSLPTDNPICLFISQSGETYDLLKALNITKEAGILSVGIVNKVESTLARNVKCGIFINAGREISVASTKAFSGQVIVLILFTLYYKQIKNEMCLVNPLYNESINFIRNSSQLLDDNLQYFSDKAKEISSSIHKHRSLFILGKGFGEAIAKEIALKIKEITYIHAEGYNAGAFKHGPLAMIDSNERTPSIILIMKDEYFDDMVTCFEQLKARNSMIICITNFKRGFNYENADFLVEIPHEGILSCFFANIVGQLISYYVSILKGNNPDKPRNLSKELTTK